MKNAVIYVNGDIAQIGAKEVTARLNEALSRLVSTVYHKLPYIDAAFGEADIRKLFAKSYQQSLSLDGGQQANAHALNDVLSFIAMNSAAHTKTSMKTLIDRFMRAPYGFVEDDVEWLVAKLFRNADIAFTFSGVAVTLMNKTSDEIVEYITKKQYADKLMTERRERANENQKKTAREVMKELFGTSGTSDDDDAIMQLFIKYCNDRLQMIKEYEIIGQSQPYPGRKVLDDGKILLRKLAQIQSSFEFFRTVNTERDALLYFAEDFEPIKTFYGGEQKKIFDNALAKMRIYDESKTFIVDDAVEHCVAEIKGILKKAAPYADIPKLPGLIKNFNDAYMAVLEDMSQPIYEALQDARKRVMDELSTRPYKAELSSRFHSLFAELKDKADRCNNVATFQNIKVEADALKMRLLNELTKKDAELAAAQKPSVTSPAADDKTDKSSAVAENPPPYQAPPKVKSISIKTVNVGGTWQVRSRTDVDARLEELRQRLYKEIEDGTVLNIEF